MYVVNRGIVFVFKGPALTRTRTRPKLFQVFASLINAPRMGTGSSLRTFRRKMKEQKKEGTHQPRHRPLPPRSLLSALPPSSAVKPNHHFARTADKDARQVVGSALLFLPLEAGRRAQKKKKSARSLATSAHGRDLLTQETRADSHPRPMFGFIVPHCDRAVYFSKA